MKVFHRYSEVVACDLQATDLDTTLLASNKLQTILVPRVLYEWQLVALHVLDEFDRMASFVKLSVPAFSCTIASDSRVEFGSSCVI